MKKICHITTGLNIGGAEMFLSNLASSLNLQGYQQTIISLQAEGDLSERIRNEKIELIHLGINRYPWTWWHILKLPFLLWKTSPDIVQTWLYHADLLGGLASVFSKTILIWNVRQTDISVKNNKKEIVIAARIAAVLSKVLPYKIICCSDTAKDSHVNIGYRENKFVVIPNGCDTATYFPDKEKRQSVRRDLNISRGDIIIGRFGRYDAQKDYKNFILAANELQLTNKNIWFLMAGENITSVNPELMKLINQCRFPDRFLLLGKRTDLPDLYQAVDIMVSSSLGEGFPNVIAEAMACEVPCVVTDVGESARLVARTGSIVPKENMQKLAHACQGMIDLGNEKRRQLGYAARLRILSSYSMDRSVEDYLFLYEKIIEHG